MSKVFVCEWRPAATSQKIDDFLHTLLLRVCTAIFKDDDDLIDQDCLRRVVQIICEEVNR